MSPMGSPCHAHRWGQEHSETRRGLEPIQEVEIQE